MKKRKGSFITFEGPEASGKSSQIILLKEYLKKKNIPFIVTREPGGTIISESIRNIILNKKNKISDLEEILMLMAARSNHIEEVIKPALIQNKIVISDRFADSTFVYQGYLNGFGINSAKKLHKDLLNNFLPNKTFLFHLNPKEIIRRLKKRKVKNKYDKNDLLFHKKISLGYKIISKNQKRFINIDATKDKKFIHKVIIENLGF
tara:strand:+ start:4524 stop:5138 length:615 start_codon:yes stop_codon:yes gene_type:complete